MPEQHLDLAKNPEYAALVEEFNKIFDGYNSINAKIREIKRPRLLFRSYKRNLKNMAKEISELQKVHTACNIAAAEFLNAPKVTITCRDGEATIWFLHFLSEVARHRKDASAAIEQLIGNFHILVDHMTTAKSFRIAYIGITLGIISSAVSIILTLWPCAHN